MTMLLGLFTGIALVSVSPPFRVTAQPSASMAVSRGALRVPFVTVTVAVSCSAAAPVTLSTLRVHHEGLGSAEDIDGLYVLDGHTRESRVQQLAATSRTATLRLRPMAMHPCSERTLTVAGNFSAEAAFAGEHRFVVESVTGLLGDSAYDVVPAPLPAVKPLRVAPSDVEAPSLTPRPLSGRITYGTARTLARFLLSGGSEDLSISALTLTNRGSATNADLQNLRIVNAKGQTLTGVTEALAEDRVRLEFSPPLVLERSTELLLEVRGDVRASVRRTVRLELEEQSDIEWETVRRRG